MSIVKVVECDTAEDFLHQLAPRGPLFAGQEATGSLRSEWDAWIFRGHTDDDFELVPSALRGRKSMTAFGATPLSNTNEYQIRSEIDLLHRFFNLADASGLPLPEDSQALRELLRETRSESYVADLTSGAQIWPPRPLWSLLAIAQHHAVPTRLLDWSYSASTSAYFAAQGVLRRLASIVEQMHRLARSTGIESVDSIADAFKLSETAAMTDPKRMELAAAWAQYQACRAKRLTVWAFAYGRYARNFEALLTRSVAGSSPSLPIAKVTAPRAGNQNLHAQDGIFTLNLVSLAGRLDAAVDVLTVDALAQKTLNEIDPRSSEWEYFYRITVPWTKIDQLMWFLAKDGINAAKIYPGYDGVVAALREERARTR